MYKTQWNLFTINTLGKVNKPGSTKDTSCSLFLSCHFFFFSFLLSDWGSLLSDCEISEFLQDIWLWLASTTHLFPFYYFDHFNKKYANHSNHMCLQCQWPEDQSVNDWKSEKFTEQLVKRTCNFYVIVHIPITKLQQISLEQLGPHCLLLKF